MNAFLSVRIIGMEINNFRDIIDKDYDLLTYHSSSEGDFFKNGRNTRRGRETHVEQPDA